MRKKLKLAVVGCGAQTEKYFLPVLKKLKDIEICTLVDLDLRRLKALARKYKIKTFKNSHLDVLGDVDVAIIALPNYLHAPVSIDFLKSGTHVFCEKPMAINYLEAIKMVEAAKKCKKMLGIGMVRKYFALNIKFKEILASGDLGKIKSFLYEEGFPYAWQTKTAYIFDKRKAGGGVLVDTGSHVLDLIIWLFGKPKGISYWDDSCGGVEANCQIKLEMGNIKGKIELSRDRTLTNKFKVVGTRGWIEKVSGGLGELLVSIDGKKKVIKNGQTFEDAIYEELKNFFRSVRSGTNEFVSGKSVLHSMKVIDYCYRHKKLIYEPWL